LCDGCAVRTFVVRIVPAEDQVDAWHGVVRRVADGVEQTFHGVDELLELMRPEPGASRTGRGTP
jgi:hypothetical protein